MSESDALEKHSRVFKYLVEHSGEILLVLRFFHDNMTGVDARTRTFKVYRLDLDEMRWVRLFDLGDHILFLGKNSSTLFRTRELGIEEGDCIYFIDDYKQIPSMDQWEVDIIGYPKEESGFDEWGSFSLKDDKFGNFCYPWREGKVEPVWITAPSWLYMGEHWPDSHQIEEEENNL
ncbi:F-box protein [Tripterygium wilfordii]|uniref:F-box protein n=1 Tax=Tripterygium wilfordii TaxID=458696 RepID=A0A7J7D6W0_TRIWF|nr:uncharacterized protein LOC120006650 isoform X1 [Tripterygium wilfordii]KAF5742105.1 F-box protein [Tripterygium wilfordii]